MKKLCNVVMLPTKKAIKSHQLFAGRISKQLKFYKFGVPEIDDSLLPQHLYVLTNDEIKEGDYGIYMNTLIKAHGFADNNIFYDYYTSNSIDRKNCKKIIASTDTSLLNLPLISEGFVKKYAELQGKIDKVMVEFEEISVHPGYVEGKGFPKYYNDFKPKLRQNNTIIISKVIDNFTERDVQVIAQDFAKFIQKETIAGKRSDGDITGWHEWFKNYDFNRLDK